ncbi:MAG: septal ring lytic transglycosylase RlpA family protein [Gammaproteobacteria bacterium]|nr:septal ring lytic transglycosylase RlpA family protein [Gammaproteobacteria bacterium]
MNYKNIFSEFGIHQIRLHILLFIVGTMLIACSDDRVKDSAPSPGSVNIDSIPNAVPRVEARSKYGNSKSYDVFGKRYYVLDDMKDFVQKGIASWYGKKFHGRRTSNGETYDMYAMTAAHKSLPLPTYVEVTNLKNNKRIIVRINDRGPFHENRVIDLSYTAARKLDIVESGTGLVEIRAIDARNYAKKPETTRPDAPLGTVSSAGRADGFYIQVGAFSNEMNAIRLQNNITSLGNNIIKVRQARVNGQLLYRVQIGPIYDVDTADNIVTRLGDFGITDHRIVVHRHAD